MGSTGPFVWWSANVDLMVVCHAVSLISAGIVIFIKAARGSSIAVAVMSSVLFTMLGVPYFSINYALQWPTLMLISAVIGFGSLSLAYSAMKLSEVLQRRAVAGAATWGAEKFPPITTVPPPDPTGKT